MRNLGINDKEGLAADTRRRTQTFVRATCSDKNCYRFAKKQRSEVGRSDDCMTGWLDDKYWDAGMLE